MRSFIHIRDVAEATLRIAREAPPGESYHLATARQLSIRALVELICAKMGAAFDEVVEVVGDRPGKDAAYLLDSQKARAAFNWTDSITLEQGIAETVEWVSQNLDTLRRQPLDYIHKP